MLPPELMITIYDFCDIESQILLNLMYNFKLDKKFDWAKCKSSLTFSEEFITEYHDKLFVGKILARKNIYLKSLSFDFEIL